VREADGQVFNRLHWVYPDGTFGFYDKAHTFRVSGEADIIARGTRREVFEWRGWRIKPAVCYDLRFPKWLRNEVLADGSRDSLPTLAYDLLIFCANWPGTRAEAWKTLLKARAIENLSYVAGVNRVGTDGAGIPYSGDSLVADFKGLPVAECTPGNEQIAVARLNAHALDTFRHHWPFHLDFD
jgi:predicted amidohydrolase